MVVCISAEFAKDIRYRCHRDMCWDTVLASHASQFLATRPRSLTLPWCATPFVQVFDLHGNPTGPDIFAISSQCFRCCIGCWLLMIEVAELYSDYVSHEKRCMVLQQNVQTLLVTSCWRGKNGSKISIPILPCFSCCICRWYRCQHYSQ